MEDRAAIYDAMKAQLEKFANPDFYQGNENSDAIYYGNPIKEAQAALKAHCFICDEPLGNNPDEDAANFHMLCAELEQASLELDFDGADFPF